MSDIPNTTIFDTFAANGVFSISRSIEDNTISFRMKDFSKPKYRNLFHNINLIDKTNSVLKLIIDWKEN
jgi:hypothetical protein